MATDPFAAHRERLLAQQRTGFTSSGSRIVGSREVLASGGVIQRGAPIMKPAPKFVGGGGPYIVPGGGSSWPGAPTQLGFTGGGGGLPSSNGGGGGGGGAPWWWDQIVKPGVEYLTGGGGGSEPAQGTPLVPGDFGPCPSGTFRLPGTQKCIDLQPGGGVQGGGMVVGGGDPVLGMHGVAMVPGFQEQTVRRCLPGMVLGNDGLCYNRSQLRKSDRAHPPARKPLMTGGDLNAISRASRVANKLKRKQKELEKIGLLKKPTRRRKC